MSYFNYHILILSQTNRLPHCAMCSAGILRVEDGIKVWWHPRCGRRFSKVSPAV